MPNNTITTERLSELYADATECATLVGLEYSSDLAPGFSLKKVGKGTRFTDTNGKVITDETVKQRLKSLVIPPAWKDVWICPNENGHILVTGVDEKGRKQYIYHPKWRIARDLLKFYRMIIFARQLPVIRQTIDDHLGGDKLDFERVMAGVMWILDNAYLRVGNDLYLEQNDSVGLTTLAPQHVMVAGPVITLAFRAKSGKDQQFTVEDSRLAQLIKELKIEANDRLFQYEDENGMFQQVTAATVNAYLHGLTSAAISAKDFRTWGGTLIAFDYLIEHDESEKKTEKISIEAVDTAASVLGNTRAVARSSYVHPHILDTYGSKNFTQYYERAKLPKRINGLDKRETELLTFLELLFAEEFDLLKVKDI